MAQCKEVKTPAKNVFFNKAKKLIGMGEGSKYNPKKARVVEDSDEDSPG